MTDYNRSGPFTNGSLPAVNDDALNNMDEGIDLAHSEIEALATLVAQKIGLPASPTIGDVLTYDGSGWIADPPVVTAGVFTGAVVWRASNNTPTGYLPMDGAAVSRTTYADLFAEIGTTHGSGDGSTTFNVPNVKKRVIVCLDPSDANFDTMGETGGAATHTLSAAEMPVHTHGVTDPGHTHYVASVARDVSSGVNDSWDIASEGPSVGTTSAAATTGISIGNAGSGSAHNNLQPYLVLAAFIKT